MQQTAVRRANHAHPSRDIGRGRKSPQSGSRELCHNSAKNTHCHNSVDTSALPQCGFPVAEHSAACSANPHVGLAESWQSTDQLRHDIPQAEPALFTGASRRRDRGERKRERSTRSSQLAAAQHQTIGIPAGLPRSDIPSGTGPPTTCVRPPASCRRTDKTNTSLTMASPGTTTRRSHGRGSRRETDAKWPCRID